jgi:ribosomal protein S12 methylthiotransferase
MSDLSIHFPPRIGFVSLGCPKALVDSEDIINRLKAEGYVIATQYHEADLVIVNTCGFIDAAVDESLDAIAEALDENGKVIVTGCLGARENGNFIRARHPRILAITGAHAAAETLTAVHRHLPRPHAPLSDLLPPQGVKLTPRHYAYLKISEGCNHHCTFCIIPDLRGKLTSRPIHEPLDEAERLLKAGVRELLVVSQDTSAYGVDTQYLTGFFKGRPLKTNINILARELDALGKAYHAWIRLHYVYPYPHVDTLIELMAMAHESQPYAGLLPYLDIPLQHASPRILKAMRRPAAAEKMLERIVTWQRALPQLTLRSTFIVGFPGETEEDFEILLDFIKEARLNRVGAFAYSPIEGARANALPDPIPEEIKEERLARLMAIQAEISHAKLQAKIGQTMDALVDQIAEVKDDRGNRSIIALARGMGDAPDIDGSIHIIDGSDLTPGTFAQVTIIDATEHDLMARVN